MWGWTIVEIINVVMLTLMLLFTDIGRPIAVIVVVSLLIITAIILIAVWYYRRNKKRKKKSETQTEMENRENVDPKPKEVTENYAVTDNQENDNYYCRVSTENMAECENVGYLIPYSDYGIREEKQQLGTEITEIEKEKEENAHALTGRQNSRTPILSQSTGQE
ncbi:uncharacterized protein LOC144353873 [Saccoglossus kowalevskii]